MLAFSGGAGTLTGANSTTDGASNTETIVTVLGAGSYAAQLCSDYEVDSQGNSPCVAGNTCYKDWFLPAGDNAEETGQLNCLYANKTAIGGFSSANYWSSTELGSDVAWIQLFDNGYQYIGNKTLTLRVRCVRAFTP